MTDPDNETFTYMWTATKNGAPYATGNTSSFTFTPDDNATYVASLKSTGATIYDNVPGASDDIDSANPQPIGGGSVVIHH